MAKTIKVDCHRLFSLVSRLNQRPDTPLPRSFNASIFLPFPRLDKRSNTPLLRSSSVSIPSSFPRLDERPDTPLLRSSRMFIFLRASQQLLGGKKNLKRVRWSFAANYTWSNVLLKRVEATDTARMLLFYAGSSPALTRAVVNRSSKRLEFGQNFKLAIHYIRTRRCSTGMHLKRLTPHGISVKFPSGHFLRIVPTADLWLA